VNLPAPVPTGRQAQGGASRQGFIIHIVPLDPAGHLPVMSVGPSERMELLRGDETRKEKT